MKLSRSAVVTMGVAVAVMATGCSSSSKTASSATTATASKTGAAATTTSAANATVAAASSTTAAAGATACMVGKWSASSVKISASGGSFTGAQGASWTIGADGSETIDWDNSGFFEVAGAAEYRYTGSQTEQVVISAAGSGTWSAKVLTDARTAVYSAAVGKAPMAVPSTAGLTETGTFTCTASAMTVTVTVDGSTVVTSLTRS